jgi:RNA recognition motif-containing protein
VNIYVGNLSFQMTEQDLRSEFEQFGKVDRAVIINDKMTGKSKGFGFVEMPNLAEAETAIKRLDGVSVKGRNLKVNEARQKDNDGPTRQARRY